MGPQGVLSLLCCVVALQQQQVFAAPSSSLLKRVVTTSRRLLNFGNLCGSAVAGGSGGCGAIPYERIAGQPVFSVTTPWGSPYLNMEKLSDLDEVVKTEAQQGSGGPDDNLQSISEEQNEYRTVALYFLDPDDALGVHGEMKQMENMAKADLRITSLSLGKALRQSSNVGKGLVTGIPMDGLTGNLKSESDGGSLRYKIVPPKRQLYYAARCIGRERVGLMSESPADDAQAAVMGNSALDGLNLVRRREKRERTIGRKRPVPPEAAHMEGYTGIPVFYCPEMKRRYPILKRLTTGVSQEAPLFFNYEDLQTAWNRMRAAGSGDDSIPSEPPAVEVFNLWDVLTSMDRYQWRQQQQPPTATNPFNKLLTSVGKGLGNTLIAERFTNPLQTPPLLKHITFVPDSRSVLYKQSISKRGNGKARLRPMKEWGPNSV